MIYRVACGLKKLQTRGYMLNKNIMLRVLVLVGMAGWFGYSVAAEPDSTARIRVIKEAKVMLFPGAYCYSASNPAAILASEGEASFFSMNKKIGMPMTSDTPANYNEFLIEANKPLTVALWLDVERDGVKAACGPIAATFIPMMGRDYDLTMGFAGVCRVQLRELSAVSADEVISRVVPASPSFACAN
jgi:hypothetical protein